MKLAVNLQISPCGRSEKLVSRIWGRVGRHTTLWGAADVCTPIDDTGYWRGGCTVVGADVSCILEVDLWGGPSGTHTCMTPIPPPMQCVVPGFRILLPECVPCLPSGKHEGLKQHF